MISQALQNNRYPNPDRTSFQLSFLKATCSTMCDTIIDSCIRFDRLLEIDTVMQLIFQDISPNDQDQEDDDRRCIFRSVQMKDEW